MIAWISTRNLRGADEAGESSASGGELSGAAAGASRTDEPPVSINPAIESFAAQIEIRDSDGQIRLHDLPSPEELGETL